MEFIPNTDMKENKTYYIYVHTAPNGKKYIGMTTNLKKRWIASKYKCNKEFYKDIIKYGWNNIRHEVLAITNYGWLARKLEKDMINRYKNFRYNTTNFKIDNYFSDYSRLHKKS